METINVDKFFYECNVGFVKLIDVMPKQYTSDILKCDESIVRSARVSFNQVSKGDVLDSKLINFLVKNQHSTPLESVVFKFHIKCPIFVQRHIVKHRTASMNEISARYTVIKDEFYIPSEFRKQASNNRQSSEGVVENSQELISKYTEACELAYSTYTDLLSSGVAKEMARMILPQSMMTEFYFTINLRNLLHLVKLRNSPDAQYETQQIAEKMERVIAELCPVSYRAFKDN